MHLTLPCGTCAGPVSACALRCAPEALTSGETSTVESWTNVGDPVPWDDALSAWVILRWVFLWGVFGYLAVPTLAQLRGVSSVTELSSEDIAAALVIGESMKAFAAAQMMRAELSKYGDHPVANPWVRCSFDTAALKRGVMSGVIAAVAARAVDAAVFPSEGPDAAREGLLLLLGAKG